jgi:hypothetical protein
MHAHRLSADDTAPAAVTALRAVEAGLDRSGLDQHVIDLTTRIGMTNLWNRPAIGLRCPHPVDQP